jgi:hypothetical protein
VYAVAKIAGTGWNIPIFCKLPQTLMSLHMVFAENHEFAGMPAILQLWIGGKCL